MSDTKITGKECSDERKRIAFQLYRSLGAMGRLRIILQQAGQYEITERLGTIGNELWDLVGQAAKACTPDEWSEANRLACESEWNQGKPYTSPWGSREFNKKTTEES